MVITKKQEDKMETNKIVPIESKNRICVHCDDEYKTTYLIAEP